MAASKPRADQIYIVPPEVPAQFRSRWHYLTPIERRAHEYNFRLMAEIRRRLDALQGDIQRVKGKLRGEL